MTLFLFYLLVVLLPTQLGRHFFFDFSLVSGIRSDYLAPTIFLTDIIIIFIIVSQLVSEKLYHRINFKYLNLFRYSNFGFRVLLFIICYLLLTSLLVASNKWVAFYKLIKIIEFVLLGVVIIRIKPKISSVIFLLSIGVFYSSIIAIWQFSLQRSVGGIFWWLGERTFSAATIGIASFTLSSGELILRPYATFPHPNVLGGFLSIVLPLILIYLLKKKKEIGIVLRIWYIMSLSLGVVCLILSISRASWIIASIGFILVVTDQIRGLVDLVKNKSKFILIFFYSILILSTIVPLIEPLRIFTNLGLSWQERTDLIKATFQIVSRNLIAGTGLNNFIVNLPLYLYQSTSLYIFQPVHNIYLLVLSETGVIGFFLFMTFLVSVYKHSLNKPFIILALTQLYLLGVFDHYLLTLQQGQLLFSLFASLALSPSTSLGVNSSKGLRLSPKLS